MTFVGKPDPGSLSLPSIDYPWLPFFIPGPDDATIPGGIFCHPWSAMKIHVESVDAANRRITVYTYKISVSVNSHRAFFSVLNYTVKFHGAELVNLHLSRLLYDFVGH